MNAPKSLPSSQVFSALESRLTNLKNLALSEQPLFIQQNPTIQAIDLIEAVYLNDNADTLEALTLFFEQDSEPLYTKQQLKEFLANDSLTASTWRNRSSPKCIITVNARRPDVLLMSVQHELTHALQHAQIKCMGEATYMRHQFQSLAKMCPEAIAEICNKYENYGQNVAQFDTLGEQERFCVSQALLEYCADIEACMILKNHQKTIDFIASKIGSSRPKEYASYALLQTLMNSQR